eukprot:g3866.t1
MSASQITQKAISRIADNPQDTSFHPIIQVISIKKIKSSGGSSGSERYRLIISDGEYYQQAMLTTRLNELIKSNTICKGCLLKLSEFICNTVQGRRIVIVMGAQVVGGSIARVGAPKNIDKRGAAPVSTSYPPPPSRKTNENAHVSRPDAHHNAANKGGGGGGGYHENQQSKYGSSSSRYDNNNGGFGGRYNKSGSGGAVQRVRPSATDDNCIPISQLNPYRSSWTIKARVTSKGAKKTWNNARGEGVLFSVDLLDSDGGEIRGTFFKEAVDKFYDVLEADQVYTFSGGRIKMANRQYSSLNCDYEITFNQYSEIQQVANDVRIKKMHFAFTKIGDLLRTEAGTMVDIVGVVVNDSGRLSLTTKTGRECAKRDLELVDQSMHQVRVTLWNDRAEKGDYTGFPVLALKGVKVGDFGGRSIGTYSSSLIVTNPDIQDAFRLRSWYDNGGTSGGSVTNISSGGGAGGGGSRAIVPLGSIKSENLGHGEKPDWIRVKATLMYAKDDRAWYEACPEQRDGRQCNKKVLAVGGDSDGPYTCEKCNKQIERCQRRYVLSCQFCDETGVQWTTLFNDEAEKILGGKTADEMNLMMESDHAQFKENFQRINFHQYIMTLMVKVETVNDESRVKATVRDLAPVDFASDAKRLLLEIDQLL